MSASPARGHVVTLVLLTAVFVLIAVGFARIVSFDRSAPAASENDAGVVSEPEVVVTVRPTDPPAYLARVFVVSLRTGLASPLSRRIRSNASAENFQASPDGRWVAFDDRRDVYLARIDGTHIHRITEAPESEIAPAWSPDGREIVFVSGIDGVSIVDVRTRIPRTLVRVPPGEQVWLPGFSGDGRTILFTRTEASGTWLEMWTIPAAGGESTRVLQRAAFGSYSPDGDTIAYHHTHRAVAPATWPTDFGVSLADADGSGRRRLTPNHCCYMTPYHYWDWTRPAWSPDGARIAYQGPDLPRDVINVVTVATGERARIGIGALPSFFDDHTLLVERYAPRG